MAMYAIGDTVIRLKKGDYNLDVTEKLLRNEHPGKAHASTIDGTKEATVISVDEGGALVEYMQSGGSYGNKPGILYYPNRYLELVKRSEEVINDYAIY